MNRIIKKITVSTAVLGLFCALLMPASASEASAQDKETIQIIATIFPAYDWVRNVVGDTEGVEIMLLLDKATDLHSFQPSVQDIAAIHDCDLFVYVGGESDTWAKDTLRNLPEGHPATLNLLDALGENAKEETLVEGMEAEEEGEEEAEYDEHVWLSLKNASILCSAIEEALCALAPSQADVFAENLASYTARLDALDEAYAQVVSNADRSVLLFADRFPFRYLVDDYGLTYYAAFLGCSAETEASFETIAFLAGKVDELNLPYVLTIEGAQHRIAETIVKATKKADQEILTMDSMQSVTAEDVTAGASYLAKMEENLEVLRTVLS